MKPAAMKRTTIMLPESLLSRALSRAKQKGISLGELIREALDALAAVTHDAERDPLFEDVVYDGPGPGDAASRHDTYLYDAKK
jgi:hypothetical protein